MQPVIPRRSVKGAVLAAALVAAFIGASVCGAGCTKKVVSQKVYSPDQLPEETDTPILDAIGGLFSNDDDKKK